MKLHYLMPLLLIAGCATSSKTYLPDGRAGYSIDCDGSAMSWGGCYEKAGDICKSAGYDIISQQGEGHGQVTGTQFGLFAGNMVTRNMVIACKAPPS